VGSWELGGGGMVQADNDRVYWLGEMLLVGQSNARSNYR
jgi:hypothetical protein